MQPTADDAAQHCFALAETADETTRQYLRTQLRAFNDSQSPHHRAIRVGKPLPLDVLIRDARGELVGGLVGSTYWGWLEVERLWIRENLRGRGYGSRLLVMAEAEARRRGCTRVHLTTFSFQARSFYERLGYRVVGQLDDYPPGGSYLWLRKDLGPPVDASSSRR